LAADRGPPTADLTMPRSRRTYDALHDINVTNLVDVVLVLLIIFMIAAPMMQAGIDISLPRTKSTPEDLGEGVVVTITKDQRIYIDQRVTNLDRFEGILSDVARTKGSQSVYLRADASIPYGLVIQIIGKIKALGIQNLGLVTEPER
jgi:biopolymer transport protein TolR